MKGRALVPTPVVVRRVAPSEIELLVQVQFASFQEPVTNPLEQVMDAVSAPGVKQQVRVRVEDGGGFRISFTLRSLLGLRFRTCVVPPSPSLLLGLPPGPRGAASWPHPGCCALSSHRPNTVSDLRQMPPRDTVIFQILQSLQNM